MSELGCECEGVSCKLASAREKVRVGGVEPLLVFRWRKGGAYHLSQMEESRSNTAIAEATKQQQEQHSNSSSRGSNSSNKQQHFRSQVAHKSVSNGKEPCVGAQAAQEQAMDDNCNLGEGVGVGVGRETSNGSEQYFGSQAE